jgi:hypothetical protein
LKIGQTESYQAVSISTDSQEAFMGKAQDAKKETKKKPQKTAKEKKLEKQQKKLSK